MPDQWLELPVHPVLMLFLTSPYLMETFKLFPSEQKHVELQEVRDKNNLMLIFTVYTALILNFLALWPIYICSIRQCMDFM